MSTKKHQPHLDSIQIRGARQHNLKNIDVDIPRNQLVVITGPSGSGKSSLAFDTLYAEGQRRYVESLSTYARQFVDQMDKPSVDSISGLSPAIAIEQRSSNPNPRSTVATMTEIYDYLRILYATAGLPHDPGSGTPLSRTTKQEMIDFLFTFPEGTRVQILAPNAVPSEKDASAALAKLQKEGFVRARIDGEIVDLESFSPPNKKKIPRIDLIVDRISLRADSKSRLFDSIETALNWSQPRVLFLTQEPDAKNWNEHPFTTTFSNPETGFTMPDLTPRHFSFNARAGACPACHGIGSEMQCDPNLLVPDPSKSLKEGAVKTWWASNKKLKAGHDRRLAALVAHFNADESAPFASLPAGFRDALFYGTGDTPIKTGWKTGPNTRSVEKPFEGLVNEAQRLYETSKSQFTKRNVARYMNALECEACHGQRLKPEILLVTLLGPKKQELGIHELTALSIAEIIPFIQGLKLPANRHEILAPVLEEISKRIAFLEKVGVGYLTLDRKAHTLSGGEAQRIRLATQIGSALSGVLYVLDEPSIGLHQSDNDKLLKTLENLRDLGNTVIVVEHDADTMRHADHLIDLGPGAGPLGGQIIAEGSPEKIAGDDKSLTGAFLSGKKNLSPPTSQNQPRAKDQNLFDSGQITIRGAKENNLQNIDVSIPLGSLVCVTGPSGSGKSTLIDSILRRELFQRLYSAKDTPGAHDEIAGLDQLDKAIVIDQSPIGRSPRSNPVTYVGAFSPIRDLLSQTQLARTRGYPPGRFSFNVAGGRCEACQGAGSIHLDMHFLEDAYVTCETCHGSRFQSETLDVTYRGKNVAAILDLTVNEATKFFKRIPKVHSKLTPLMDVGLGYLKLGQAATTLSGGEAQRIKLASELGKRATGKTVYLLDEPTTGLHFADIETLLEVLFRLRDSGNSIIVIEHNLDVIKCADWVIDLGPGGGPRGGKVVAQGSPISIAENSDSLTGQYLAPLIKKLSR
ncbi:MAG: excinuclease ABC subunit UvrA [Verrucomicrobiota bacterium]